MIADVDAREVDPSGLMCWLSQTLLERVRTMGHAIWLPASPRGCNVRAHDPDGSKLDTCAREGRRLSFDIDAQAHQTIEQDMQAARAAQLEGEETRTPTMTDKQTAAPDNIFQHIPIARYACRLGGHSPIT